MDMEIDLPFDEEYTKKYNERQKIISERRYQMLMMFRKDIAYKWKDKMKFIKYKKV